MSTDPEIIPPPPPGFGIPERGSGRVHLRDFPTIDRAFRLVERLVAALRRR
jgi:hypothetical protein